MIEPIDAPAGVVAFKAVGTIDAEDYADVLRPAVERALVEHGKVRLVFMLGPEFNGYTAASDRRGRPGAAGVELGLAYQFLDDVADVEAGIGAGRQGAPGMDAGERLTAVDLFGVDGTRVMAHGVSGQGSLKHLECFGGGGGLAAPSRQPRQAGKSRLVLDVERLGASRLIFGVERDLLDLGLCLAQ